MRILNAIRRLLGLASPAAVPGNPFCPIRSKAFDFPDVEREERDGAFDFFWKRALASDDHRSLIAALNPNMKDFAPPIPDHVLARLILHPNADVRAAVEDRLATLSAHEQLEIRMRADALAGARQ